MGYGINNYPYWLPKINLYFAIFISKPTRILSKNALFKLILDGVKLDIYFIQVPKHF